MLEKLSHKFKSPFKAGYSNPERYYSKLSTAALPQKQMAAKKYSLITSVTRGMAMLVLPVMNDIEHQLSFFFIGVFTWVITHENFNRHFRVITGILNQRK